MSRFRALLLLLAMAAPAGAADDAVLNEFLAWYKAYTGSYQPAEVAAAYAAKLKASGLEASQVESRIEAIRKAVGAMPAEFAALHFDHIYRFPNPPFQTEASRFLIRVLEGRKPGKALDVAMGQGRNALYLASQGWDVTGYDISGEGLAMARAAAEKAGVKLKAVQASHEQFDYGKEQWDLIVETFAFTNLSDTAYRRRVLDSLKPGGLLVIEGFGDPGRRDPKNAMLEGFSELRLMHYEDRDDIADWGLQKARLMRLAAEKDR